MSNRSYLIGLYIGLATIAVGALLILGNLFAHANNNQPPMSPSEMHYIINQDQYFNNKDKNGSHHFSGYFHVNHYKSDYIIYKNNPKSVSKSINHQKPDS
ncbi:hypothetical protein [Nicoliella lavandulae]|uniref:Uncharacterized protein n=1 Tax=Nicoliella lavandulae TaxID=3082954 RepID=A0ABU8SM77_9LACO